MTKKRNLAFISIILFSAHPVHTARVANMTASFDLLGILFMFLSIWLYIKYSKDNRIRNLILSIGTMKGVPVRQVEKIQKAVESEDVPKHIGGYI